MAKYTNSELCLIWLDSISGLDYKHKREIYGKINGKEGIKDFLVNNKEEILSVVSDLQYKSLLDCANANYLSIITEGLERRGVTAVTIDSINYPDKLAITPYAPLVLYAKGNIELLNSECFAIVGSRKSLPVSIGIAEDFSEALSNAGLTLVTGIAEGVDQKVIETALENSGRVISVLGGGFDNIYPASNTKLVEEVIEKGLVITEYTPEIKAVSYNFPIRNRIIAGLSRGTLVVSGKIKSGTQYTANYAVEYSRDLFAIPYSLGISSGAGCNYLIKNGAMLCDSPSDILSLYGLEEKEQTKIELSEEQALIIKALSEGELHVQQIAQIIDKQVFEASSLLGGLEILGLVKKNGVNVYGLTKNVLEE